MNITHRIPEPFLDKDDCPGSTAIWWVSPGSQIDEVPTVTFGIAVSIPRDHTVEVGPMVKKVAMFATVAFLIFFVAYRPASAAAATKWLGKTIASIATGFGDYASRLF
jgi:hypothetical protein